MSNNQYEEFNYNSEEVQDYNDPVEKDNTVEMTGVQNSPGLGFLELIYGILFEPVKTFKQIAFNPPIGQAVIIYLAVKLLSGIMGAFINANTMAGALTQVPPILAQVIHGMVPLFILLGLLIQFIKWFVYSGVLHLLADFYGGAGTARGVFTVYGLAALPTVFLIPVQLLLLVLSPGEGFVNLLIIPVTLALAIWGFIILILGVREVHEFSTGRSVLVIFTPVIAIILLVIIAAAVLFSVAASLPHNLPGIF
ncbi:MAG: YIP1 family protein [Clostridiales bacterium]|nr:YIP1 family protein [Clostridiales bacterium]MCF8022529.1 YIP1 family protein [Clostridiales bacterium]